MKLCLVCGHELDAGAENCSKCHTPVSILNQMEEAPNRRRFFFGSSSELPPVAAPPTPPPRPKPANMAQPAGRRPRPEARRQPAAKPVIRKSLADYQGEDTTILRGKTARLANKPKWPVLVAFFVDLVAVTLLNSAVFFLITLASGRDASSLVTYSFMPILLTLVTFVVLYFGLFWTIFHRTMGGLILGALRRNQRPSPA